MKVERHSKIVELIGKYEIETQEELAERLNAAGYRVTQATVSRDIRELKLSKVQAALCGAAEPGVVQRQIYPNPQGWVFVRRYGSEYFGDKDRVRHGHGGGGGSGCHAFP